MAQGEILGLLVRLYEITDRPEYLDYARGFFHSLFRLRPEGRPWVARIDSLGYYWLEEFPHDERPGMTLNGYIAAIYGVYDYYRVTHNEDALMLYELCLTTIKHYLPEFRRPGQSSFYDLGHRFIAKKNYHDLHVSMMFHLHRMSGDPFFEEMGQALRADTERPPTP